MDTYTLNIGQDTLRARPAALDCINKESPDDHWFTTDEHPAIAAGHAHRMNKRNGKRNAR